MNKKKKKIDCHGALPADAVDSEFEDVYQKLDNSFIVFCWMKFMQNFGYLGPNAINNQFVRPANNRQNNLKALKIEKE